MVCGSPKCQGFPHLLFLLFMKLMTKWIAVFRTNHSMFEYKVIDAGKNGISYTDVSLSNCFVQEIRIICSKNLETTLPPQFGFFPRAEVCSRSDMFPDNSV